MAIFKRGKTYWIRFTAPDGTRIRESAQTTNPQLAAKFETKRKHELFEAHKMGVAVDRPFPEAVKHFLKAKRLEGLRTVDTYQQQLEWWQQQFEGVSLQQIDEGRIVSGILVKADEVTHLGDVPTPATLNRYLAALRACLNMAHNARWIIRVPKFVGYDEPKARIRWLTSEERAALLIACPEHWRGMVRLSLATGLRQSNVRAMQWDWVDFETKTLTIPGQHFKNGNEFCIPLNAEAIEVLREQEGRHGQFVFTYNGEPITQISHEAWKQTLARAGIEDFRWHDLRHTWATDMARKGVPTHALQKLGGWETMAMVNKYAHHDVESLRQYVESPSSPTPEQKVAQNWHKQGERRLKLVA